MLPVNPLSELPSLTHHKTIAETLDKDGQSKLSYVLIVINARSPSLLPLDEAVPPRPIIGGLIKLCHETGPMMEVLTVNPPTSFSHWQSHTALHF